MTPDLQIMKTPNDLQVCVKAIRNLENESGQQMKAVIFALNNQVHRILLTSPNDRDERVHFFVSSKCKEMSLMVEELDDLHGDTCLAQCTIALASLLPDKGESRNQNPCGQVAWYDLQRTASHGPDLPVAAIQLEMQCSFHPCWERGFEINSAASECGGEGRRERNQLIVKLLRARHLAASKAKRTRRNGESCNPFAAVSLLVNGATRNATSSVEKEEVQCVSRVKLGDQSPIFAESFAFALSPAQLSSSYLVISISDSDREACNELLGQTKISLSRAPKSCAAGGGGGGGRGRRRRRSQPGRGATGSGMA